MRRLEKAFRRSYWIVDVRSTCILNLDVDVLLAPVYDLAAKMTVGLRFNCKNLARK